MDRSVDRIVVDLKDCQRTLPRLTNSRKLPTLNMKVLLVADFNDDGIEEVLVLITESNKQRLAFFNLRDNEDFAKTPMFHNTNNSSYSFISEQQQIGTISIDENGSAQISSHHNNQQQKTETINDIEASAPNTTTDIQPPFVLPSSSLIVAPTYGVDGMIQTPKIHVPVSKNNSSNQNSITINSNNTPNTSTHQQHQSVPSTNAGRALFSSSLATNHNNINQSQQQQAHQETASRSHNNTAPIFALPRNNGTKMTEIRLSNLPLFDEEDMIIVNSNNKNDTTEGGAAGVGSASVVMNNENKKKHPFTRRTINYTIVDVHLVHYSESTCSAGGFAAKSATAAAATNLMNTQNNKSGNPMMTSSVSSPLIDEFYHHHSHHHSHHQHQQPTTPHPQASSFSPNNTASATNQSSSATAATSRRIGGGLVIVLLEGLVIHIPARALNPNYIQQNCSNNMQRANIQLDKVEEHLEGESDVDGVGVEEQYADDMTSTSDPTKTTINRIIHVPSNQLEAIWQIPWNCCSSSMETSHAIPHTIFCGFPCGLILSMPIGQHLKTILALQEQQQQQQGAEHNNTMNSVLSNGTLPVSASGANISSQYYHQHHSHSNQNPSLSSSSVTPTHHQHHQHAASTTSLSGMLSRLVSSVGPPPPPLPETVDTVFGLLLLF